MELKFRTQTPIGSYDVTVHQKEQDDRPGRTTIIAVHVEWPNVCHRALLLQTDADGFVYLDLDPTILNVLWLVSGLHRVVEIKAFHSMRVGFISWSNAHVPPDGIDWLRHDSQRKGRSNKC